MSAAGLRAVHRPVPCRLVPSKTVPWQVPAVVTALCCAGYTPEVVTVLRRLRLSGMHASEPLTRDARGERSLSLDGVTTAYRYVLEGDDDIPASFHDEAPKSPCEEYIFP